MTGPAKARGAVATGAICRSCSIPHTNQPIQRSYRGLSLTLAEGGFMLCRALLTGETTRVEREAERAAFLTGSDISYPSLRIAVSCSQSGLPSIRTPTHP